LFYRIIGEEDTDCWVYSICPRDFRDIVDHEKREVYTDFSMPCSIEFSASVRFPVSDYDTICNLLQQSVKRRKS
jgi:hypothetical protein